MQQFQSLVAARARASLARKAVADATVRAPFAGVVAERLVSVGDYVTRGMKIATVLRIDPLSFPPEVLLKPKIAAAKLDIRDFKLARVGQFDGPVIRSLSSSAPPSLLTTARAAILEPWAASVVPCASSAPPCSPWAWRAAPSRRFRG